MAYNERNEGAKMAADVTNTLLTHFFAGRKQEAMLIWQTIGLRDRLVLFSYLGSAIILDDISKTSLTCNAALEIENYILNNL